MKRIVAVTLTMLLLVSIASYAAGESSAITTANAHTTYAIRADGSLWGWGSEYVGTGSENPQITPVRIMDNVRSVSSSSWARLAVKKDDTLWAWGYIVPGFAVGPNNGYDETYLSPTKLAIEDVASAATGNGYILALKKDGSLWVCGDMFTGDGTDTMADGEDGFKKVADDVTDMFAGGDTVYLIKEDHTLWGYGDNSNAQLGNMTIEGDTSTDSELSMTKILEDVKYVTADIDGDVVMAIRLDNSLYGWATGGFYTEEFGWIEDAGKPYKIMDDVKKSVADGSNAFIIKTDNTLWAWGYSFEGKSVSDEEVPYMVTGNVRDFALGNRHIAVIKTDNTLWVMGGNYRGTLGYEVDATWYTPLTQVLTNIQDIPASWAVEEVEKAIGEQLVPDDMQGNYTQSVSREDFCILAIRMIEARAGMDIDSYLAVRGLELAPADTFTDCSTKEVLAAKTLGITDGTSATTFSPDNLLTREMAAKFLTTTAIACGKEVNLSTPAYADKDQIAGWAQPYTGYVYDINVMKGVGANKFDPQGSYQRQQAFMTMYRIWKEIEAVTMEPIATDEEVVTQGRTEDLLLYKVKEITDNEPGSEGMFTQIFYSTDADYGDLVAYFTGLLEKTEDYDLYQQEGRTSFDGTLNGELVIVIVNDYMTTEPSYGVNGVNVNFYEME